MKYGGIFDVAAKQDQLRDVEETIEGTPDFWNNPGKSAPILKQKRALETALDQSNKLKSLNEDLKAALELAKEGDDDYLAESHQLLGELTTLLSKLEVQSLLSGELDDNDAVITINSGAGGTEACDWAGMLYRMYTRFAERHGWEVEVYDLLDGEEAGIKNVTFEIRGTYVFGLLKAESGVHRLVRISPFDSNARRHTSFASVYVSPVVDDDIEISINESDLRVDTYRASGAGGQHVNRTDSAVRITHAPSGVVVQCQSQRSQHQNREQAMKLLRSKLFELELQNRQEKQAAVESEKSEIGFGSQIRNYVLHPYKLVKDVRTNHEIHSPDQVLDGDLDEFIREYLVHIANKS